MTVLMVQHQAKRSVMMLEMNPPGASITHAPQPSNECGNSVPDKLSYGGLAPDTVWDLLFRAHDFAWMTASRTLKSSDDDAEYQTSITG